MTNMGTDFKAPAKKEARQWRKVQVLAEAGVTFFPQWFDGNPGKRPDTLAEVPTFLRRINPLCEGELLLERISEQPQQAHVAREGKLSIQGLAPHQTFHLLGTKLVTRRQVQVLRRGGWVNAEIWEHPSNPEQPSSLQTFKLVEGGLRYRETLPLDGTLRLRWPLQ